MPGNLKGEHSPNLREIGLVRKIERRGMAAGPYCFIV
jgi:hypothetical protein